MNRKHIDNKNKKSKTPPDSRIEMISDLSLLPAQTFKPPNHQPTLPGKEGKILRALDQREIINHQYMELMRNIEK